MGVRRSNSCNLHPDLTSPPDCGYQGGPLEQAPACPDLFYWLRRTHWLWITFRAIYRLARGRPVAACQASWWHTQGWFPLFPVLYSSFCQIWGGRLSQKFKGFLGFNRWWSDLFVQVVKNDQTRKDLIFPFLWKLLSRPNGKALYQSLEDDRDRRVLGTSSKVRHLYATSSLFLFFVFSTSGSLIKMFFSKRWYISSAESNQCFLQPPMIIVQYMLINVFFSMWWSMFSSYVMFNVSSVCDDQRQVWSAWRPSWEANGGREVHSGSPLSCKG